MRINLKILQDLKDVNFQDWIYPGAFPPIKKTDVLLEENDTVHGTSIIGRIAGRVSGIAPEAEIVVVRTTSVPEGGYGYVDYLDALIKIYDHIKTYNSESSGIVINFAVNPSFSSLTADYMTQLHRFSEEVVRRIHDLDNVIIVAAAGNQKPVRGTTSCLGGRPLPRSRIGVLVSFELNQSHIRDRKYRFKSRPCLKATEELYQN